MPRQVREKYKSALEYANQHDVAMAGIIVRDLFSEFGDSLSDIVFRDQYRGQGITHVLFPGLLFAVR